MTPRRRPVSPNPSSRLSPRHAGRTRLATLGFLLGALLAPAPVPAAAAASTPVHRLPVVTVTHDDTIVTQSCRLRFSGVIADTNNNGVIQIRADGLTLAMDDTGALRGAPAGTPWNELKGIGLHLGNARQVRLLGLRIHGYRNGLVATNAHGLVIDGGDFSDNYRQRLRSTPEAEDGADWLFPHGNDDRKWRDQYGGAVCIESSTNVVIRQIRVRRGQNGIILDRVTDSAIYDNDCSFLSGWGLALWRSSRNRITRNAFDFCVRGHVEGVYNRGQDSAGILAFEQCNDNLIAENSATHGGDCFFGFAGHDAIGEKWMNRERERLRRETGRREVDDLIVVPPALAASMSALGCNRNRLIRNDFSYAPAHGIEMTFSEDNEFVENRLVENAICGIWGGYSSGTWIVGNEFTGNGGMAYGLERGAINMEHAADNRILDNRFLNNKCAIHLWWDNDGALLRFPGVAGNARGVTGNVIAGNRLIIDPHVPFRGLRPDSRLFVLQFRDSGTGHVSGNVFRKNRVRLSHPLAVEFDGPPGTAPDSTGPIPDFRRPRYDALGKSRPVGARPHLRGRHRILMDEWGPWDHEAPFIRTARPTPGEQSYDLFGFKSGQRVEVLEGDVVPTLHPLPDSASPRLSPRRDDQRLTLRPRASVASYRIRISTDSFSRELSGTLFNASWQVRFFPWTIDPREDLAGWRNQAQAPNAVATANVPRIDFPFGMGGPRDLAPATHLTGTPPAANRFGVIAQTTLPLPRGRWRFRTLSDDGVRVLVNGRPVIENWTWHVPTTNEGIFEQATDEPAQVTLEYFEIDGLATLRLDVEPDRR